MKVIICGSMTASREMVSAKESLETVGHEVIVPEFTEDYAKLDTIDKMHTESARNKIDYDLLKGYFETIKEGDVVLIVNEKRHDIEGYVGGNTLLEMGFAYVLEKPIYLLNQMPEMSYRDEIVAMQPIVLNGDLEKILE